MSIFDRDRYGFCVIGGKLVIMDADHRTLHTDMWMENILRLSRDDIDLIPRGYLLPNRIQFFSGNYNTCPKVGEDIIGDAVACHASLYGNSIAKSLATSVYNGVVKGEEGAIWQPVLEWDFDIGRWEIIH